MFTATNNSSKKTAPPRPGIFNRKLPPTRRISMLTIFNLLSFIFCLVFCQRSTEPLEKALPEQEFTLTVESAEVTGVWLKLQAQPLDERISYLVQRGDTHTVFSGKLLKHDTLLHDFNLQPARDYEYKAYRLVDGHKLPPPVVVTTTTMDTTSHDFTWQIFEFGGEKGSSSFYDVAIINENDIWAVGQIYTADTYTYDSLGNWIQPYNAAHWDGEKWELKRIPFVYQGSNFWGPIYSIYAFSENNVWFGMGSVIHFDGKTFKSIKIPDDIFPSRANKIWGTSNNDLYIVGNRGCIAHYNGVSWRRIESPEGAGGTDLDIYDIWGQLNIKTGEYEIICVGSKHLQDPHFRKVIVKIEGYNLIELSSTPIKWSLYTCWFVPGIKYLLGGGGLYYKNKLNSASWRQLNHVAQYYTYRIRGNHINDIMAVGGFAEIVHFNGSSWRNYVNEINLSGNFYSVDIHGNVAAVTGFHGRKAVVVMGKRY